MLIQQSFFHFPLFANKAKTITAFHVKFEIFYAEINGCVSRSLLLFLQRETKKYSRFSVILTTARGNMCV